MTLIQSPIVSGENISNNIITVTMVLNPLIVVSDAPINSLLSISDINKCDRVCELSNNHNKPENPTPYSLLNFE